MAFGMVAMASCDPLIGHYLCNGGGDCTAIDGDSLATDSIVALAVFADELLFSSWCRSALALAVPGAVTMVSCVAGLSSAVGSVTVVGIPFGVVESE